MNLRYNNDSIATIVLLVVLVAVISLTFGSVTVSNNSIVGQQETNKGNNDTIAQILPSWNEGETRETIIGFVSNITNPNSPTYLPPEKRIAVLDNDGTMWAEKPLYFQGYFALDRLENLSVTNPN